MAERLTAAGFVATVVLSPVVDVAVASDSLLDVATGVLLVLVLGVVVVVPLVGLLGTLVSLSLV